MQPAKVKNQQEHERLLERIKKTKNIDQQQIVGVQLIGHSADAVSLSPLCWIFCSAVFSTEILSPCYF